MGMPVWTNSYASLYASSCSSLGLHVAAQVGARDVGEVTQRPGHVGVHSHEVSGKDDALSVASLCSQGFVFPPDASSLPSMRSPPYSRLVPDMMEYSLFSVTPGLYGIPDPGHSYVGDGAGLPDGGNFVGSLDGSRPAYGGKGALYPNLRVP